MTDLRAGVFAAPLRPGSAAVSAFPTAKLMHCSTSDSPLNGWKSRISRRCSVSGMLASQIGVEHVVVSRDRRVVALGEYCAAPQHGDRIAQIRDDLHIVFDHQDRAA